MFSKLVLNKSTLNRHLSTLKRCCSSSGGGEQKTPLYELHQKHGGKMVPFAGFTMPVQYGSHSISASHLHTRSKLSVFDVSHMLQTVVRGKHCQEWVESICVADVQGLESGKGTLSLFTNGAGGIVDDLIVTKTSEDSLFLVSNASRRQVDMELMLEAQKRFTLQGKDVHLSFLPVSERGLIAIQGPLCASILQNLINIDLSTLYFMSSTPCILAGVECRVTRAGYTGEDGVEISAPAGDCEHLVGALLENEDVKLAGLGARDSLRLEAGLCLYGNDMDETTTPVEAGLTWTIGKRRRESLGFPGARIILDQIKTGVSRKRTGFTSTGAPIRGGYEIVNSKGEPIGVVTSGCPSPSLKKNIAMGYIEPAYSKAEGLRVRVRDKLVDVTLSKMPFVKSNYYTLPKQAKSKS
uniref:Aminomethyltransferase n=1 Tax=Cacopsylla melanoneura TaxID=428564 RepID=A0A8D9FDE3_9HEMI